MEQLSARRREILRRVVEEHVATGQPVGSKVLVERAGMHVSSSTVRSELAELESLGLLTHPHTSAGRVPTESGYRIYAEELVGAIDGRPEPPPFDVSSVRSELEGALRSTTETLSQATRLLALVSAPALDVGDGAPRRRPAAAAARRDRRRDHLDGRGHEAGARARAARRPGPRRLGPHVPGGAGRSACASARRRCAGAWRTRRCRPSERAFLGRLRTAFVDAVADEGPQLFVGGAAGLLGDARGAELEACQHLLDVLERRAAVLELLSDALDPRRTVVRVGPEVDGGQLHDVSYVGATYGLARRSLGSVALLGPLRMDYEKAIRAVRAAAFELSRLAEDVYEDD